MSSPNTAWRSLRQQLQVNKAQKVGGHKDMGTRGSKCQPVSDHGSQQRKLIHLRSAGARCGATVPRRLLLPGLPSSCPHTPILFQKPSPTLLLLHLLHLPLLSFSLAFALTVLVPFSRTIH